MIFSISTLDINYLRETLPTTVEEEFFNYLRNLTPKDLCIYALDEGCCAFPRQVSWSAELSIERSHSPRSFRNLSKDTL